MSRSVRLAAQANSIAVLATATDEQLQRASQLLKEAEEASPQGTTWLQIGRAYMELDDFSASHRALDKARERLKNNPALELFSAILALDEDDVEQAKNYLEALQKMCPGNQALPTAQALCLLLQKNVPEAIKLLRSSRSKGESYDVTVSPLLVSRLAITVEELVLPCELPPRELIDDHQENSEAQDVTSEAQGNNSEAQGSVRFVQELESILPPLPEGVTIGGFSLQRGGTDRLQRSWDLPIPERFKQFTIAVHELLRSYKRSPKAYQAAFCLAEGLLALAEYGRERSERYGSKQMAWVRSAEKLLREALVCDKDVAFASHYLARTQLLQYRFAEAEKLWRQALAEFEKLPEAQYGLGQALMMSGKRREGRLCITQAVNADMRLLRERLADLAQICK